MRKWLISADGATDARDDDVFGPNTGVITQEYLDAARSALGLPKQASDNAVLARLKLQWRVRPTNIEKQK